jgi:hypothetical protein
VSRDAILLLTLGVALSILGLGLWLAFGRHRVRQRDLGVGLISGASFGLAVFALQLYNDNVAQRAQDRQEEAARRETVELAIATTSDLSGFDPRGQSLVDAYLVGKTLNGARFEDVDLTDAELRDTQLRGALLSGAKLKNANLIGAHLDQADLEDANLSGAHLHAAKFVGAAVEHIESLEGAEANADTCWPTGFLTSKQTKRLVNGLNPEGITREDGKEVPPSPGHTCTERDKIEAGD